MGSTTAKALRYGPCFNEGITQHTDDSRLVNVLEENPHLRTADIDTLALISPL